MGISSQVSARAWHATPVLLGGVFIAAANAVFATCVWFPWTAAGVTRMFQSIAVGVLGKSSYQNGISSAALGATLHVVMATVFVLVYTLAARRIPVLVRRPTLFGAPYGLALYGVMNFVVMPLSRVAATPTLAHPDWIIESVLMHVVFGVTCAWFARRALATAA